jgi:hypothetical protein
MAVAQRPWFCLWLEGVHLLLGFEASYFKSLNFENNPKWILGSHFDKKKSPKR